MVNIKFDAGLLCGTYTHTHQKKSKHDKMRRYTKEDLMKGEGHIFCLGKSNSKKKIQISEKKAIFSKNLS